MSLLLSIIIPTHNRQNYAEQCVRTILNNFDNIEIVLSDTSDSDTLKSIFSNEILDGKIIYVRPPVGISVVSNFETGFKHSTGDYLIFIGDDDCIGPEVDRVVAWAEKNNIEAITHSNPAHYYWGDFESLYSGSKYSGKLTYKDFDGFYHLVNSNIALSYALDNLGEGLFDMPRAYMGLISRTVCARIVHKYKNLFGGVSPDIYSSALISHESKRTYYIDYPIVMAGSSGASTAGHSAKRTHKGGLTDNAHIGAFKNLVWDKRVPEFYSVPTVWGYSLLKAVDVISDDNLKPNFENLYANCFFFHRNYYKEIFESINYYSLNSKKSKIEVYGKITVLTFRLVTRLTRKAIHKFIISKLIPDLTVTKASGTLESFEILLKHTSAKQINLN